MNIILSVFNWILDASLRASLLAVAVLILQFALRSLISARCRYALWLPVLLVLVLPVLPRSRWSAENLFAARAHAPAQILSAVAVVEETSTASPLASVSSPDWKEEAAGIVWAAGAALSLGAGLVLYKGALRRYMLAAEAQDDSLTRMIGSLCAELHLRHSPRVILSRVVESPAVTGLLRPMLLLPADFAATFDGKEARLVLKHELMHLKRFDLRINALVCFLNALHWFNPVLWLATWRARQDRESACDAQVLISEPCDCRGDYGGVLLKIQSVHYTRGLSLGFVGIFEAGRVLRSRIEAIARYRRHGPVSGIAAGAAIMMLGVLGATHAQPNQPVPGTTPVAKTAPLDHTESIRNKLNRIIIPKIEFRDATLREAVDFLKEKSKELDTEEPDPSRRGVNIVLMLDVTFSKGMTLSVSNIPLGEALKYVCELANVKFKIDPYAVIIVPPSMNTDEMITKEYKVAGGFIPKRQAAMDVLTAHGVQFPPGASAVYFPATSRLIVHDTSSNVDLIDALVEKFPGSPATPPPPAPTPVPGSIEDKLNRIIIPKLEFKDVTVGEAVDFLTQKSVDLDITEPDSSRRGVSITLKAGTRSDAKITISLTNTPLMEAVNYIAQLAGLKCSINPSGVVLEPLSGPAP